jgi:DNA polymerase-3 subunit gamma/tau
MSYQVLARRLRPQRFADVVGQEHVTRTLQSAITAGRVAHAFLLTGPRGVGKTTTARVLAKALNCEAGPGPEPCNACSTCREIAEGSAFDVLEIDGASHTQVDKMRDLMETVAHRPIKSRFKIFIIDEVHMLSQHSFNALLKTLEEPPPHAKFVFATTDPHKVLATVASRCQRYDLRRIDLGMLVAHLRQTVAAEGAALSDEVLTLIAREAEGSLRDAQSLLEQVLTAAGGDAGEAAAREVLGAADRRLVVAVVDAVLASDAARCMRELTALYEYGYDAQRFCRDLLEHFRHLAVLAATGQRELLAELPEAEIAVLERQAALRSADDLQRCFALLLEVDEALAQPARTVDPQLVLEMRVLRLATLPPLLPVAEILERLERVGGRGPSGGGVSARAVGPAAPARSAGPPRAPAPPGRSGAAPPSAPAPARPGAPAAAAPAGAEAGTRDAFWQRFLERVRAERLAVYMMLVAGHPVGLDDQVLRIGIDSETMRRDASRREVVDLLQTAAGAVAGRPLRVEIGPLPAEHSGDTAIARGRKRTEDTLADPMVQAAVEIFGGEVRGVRERRPRGGETP